jgi:hypothetical protein
MIDLASFDNGPSSFQELMGVVAIAVVAIGAGLASRSVLIGMIAGCKVGALVEIGLFLIYGLIVGAEVHVMASTVAGGMLGSLAGAIGRWYEWRSGG